jgi:hypothetical protein
MTAWTWREGDPEPEDHPAVVDPDGTTWLWVDDPDDLGTGYQQRLITHYGQSSLVTIPCPVAWADAWERLPEGAELREATTAEACTWVEQWTAVSA